MKKLKIESDTMFQIISEIPGYEETICNWIPNCVRCFHFWKCEKVEGERGEFIRIDEDWKYQEDDEFLPTGDEDHPENDLIQYEFIEEQTDFVDKNDSDTDEDIQHEMYIDIQESKAAELEYYKQYGNIDDFCINCPHKNRCRRDCDQKNEFEQTHTYKDGKWLEWDETEDSEYDEPERDLTPYL